MNEKVIIMEVKITKKIISNDKEFKIGNDVCFDLLRNNKTYEVFGIITEIEEDKFRITQVQLDKMNLYDDLVIKYTEVKDGELHLTDNGWY